MSQQTVEQYIRYVHSLRRNIHVERPETVKDQDLMSDIDVKSIEDETSITLYLTKREHHGTV